MGAALPPAGQPLVIGGGKVGTAIARMHRPPARILRRGERVPEHDASSAAPAPIWVCTTADALDDVVTNAVPASRRADLVLVQNGMLTPWLAARGLEPTQVLLYMAAGGSGSGGQQGGVADGRLTLVHGGRWAAEAAALLAAGGVAARVEADWGAFQRAGVAKLLWAAIFWLLSAARGSMPVGEIATRHAADVEALARELLPLADGCVAEAAAARRRQQHQQHEGEERGQADRQQEDKEDEETAATTERRAAEVVGALLAYSLSIPEAVPSAEMARREWRWRNGFFVDRAAALGVATPLHDEWIRRAGGGGMLLPT